MRFIPVLIMLVLTGCTTAPQTSDLPEFNADSVPTAKQAVENFFAVVKRVEPAAERACRAVNPAVNCDFQIAVDDDLHRPSNAFQTIDRNGRPFIVFTIALIAEVQNQDELAFILGHEAAHHIENHLPRQQESAMRGAVLAGMFATLGGGDSRTVRSAQDFGAEVGARTFSKDFELEADRLGTVIAIRAGYDPVRGAAYFTRFEDPENVFLGTHPPNSERIEAVRRTAAQVQ